jgi:peptidoglycan/xylan/chitin deacetylase (PgdA/CDA1 family)
MRHTVDSGTIALTFDDGPDASTTPRLLDLLDRHDTRATFFVLGTRARAHPALVQQIAGRGHAIGNHTDTHPRLVWHGSAAIERELQRCQTAIADATGRAPTLHRPPFGYRHPRFGAVAMRVGLTRIVMWSRMTRDWTGAPAVIHRRCAAVRDRDIVVLHDGDYRRQPADRESMLRALEVWLPRWRDAGLRSVALA